MQVRSRMTHTQPVPEDYEFAVWIDFRCLGQDKVSGEELNAAMVQIMQYCDLVLTPVVDADYTKFSRPMVASLNATQQGRTSAGYREDISFGRFKRGQLDVFEEAGWQEYFKRAWCRIEMCHSVPRQQL
jgi:hypothetical protein